MNLQCNLGLPSYQSIQNGTLNDISYKKANCNAVVMSGTIYKCFTGSHHSKEKVFKNSYKYYSNSPITTFHNAIIPFRLNQAPPYIFLLNILFDLKMHHNTKYKSSVLTPFHVTLQCSLGRQFRDLYWTAVFSFILWLFVMIKWQIRCIKSETRIPH